MSRQYNNIVYDNYVSLLYKSYYAYNLSKYKKYCHSLNKLTKLNKVDFGL